MIWDHQIIDDLSADPEYADSMSVKIGLRAALLLPIRVDGRLDTIVTFQSKQPGAFKRDDVLVARRIVDHMALALSHERLAEEQRRNDVLRAKSDDHGDARRGGGRRHRPWRASRGVGAHLRGHAEGHSA